ncbi:MULTISPECIES: CdaR family protein [Staphylococcus]|jgi:YbbR domain-containing protein|uniref:YbbR-like domain-containing protein n=1 Tax=Staphylococcus shinii TaxID=2912228 RepID=A0A418IF99_9STAP|nr:CdaR family protein [Staphylococcus shinii]MBO3066254.1 YbbR-like domain-containing protein [Staphylococcus shinii]MDW8565563.1 CdaR family protein [Staphylococcus shinii]MDW8568817.1 CdaR family protein [Staphylococcus shinii]MDW8568984.1 CdaR family protein [Staphylococcus shinii]MDW8572433.1 CdaR family protein [Staphylococcus shinii]
MLESKWGLRLIALVLALVFFLSVNNMFGNIFNADNLGQKSSETIQEVPVQVKYNNKSLYASEVPDKVDVEISGPQSQVLKAENGENIKAVLDLSGEKAGKHTTQFQVNGLNKDIDYSVKPKEATVNLEERVSKTLKVEPDVSNNDLDSDYKISEQSVSPETVKVTGGQDQIDKIAYLKATYKNKSKIAKNTTDVAKITAFDRNLNKIDVSIQPNEVNLSVKVEDYSKKVKVKTKAVGSLSNGRELDNINLEDEEVEIYGNKDDLEDIDEITANVNLDNISDTTEKNVKFKVPEDVTKVNPSGTTAKITVK